MTMRHAFSLIELLVVITIIAILASILMPSVAMVRAAARSTTCLAHIRQLQLAVEDYATNNDGQLVLTKLGYSVQKQWESLLAAQIPDILGGDSNINQSVSGTTAKRNLVRGCPDFKVAINASVGSALQWTSGYGFNERPLIEPKTVATFGLYNWLWGAGGGGNGTPMNLSQVPYKSLRVAFGDADDYWLDGLGAGQNWWSATQPREWESSGNRTSGFIKPGMEGYRRHRGKANYTFFDGHAEKLDSAHALDRQLDPGNQLGANLP